MFTYRFLLLLTVFFTTFSTYALPPELEGVVDHINHEAFWGSTPVVITDLDETILDSTTRRFYSYLKSADEICEQSRIHSCGLVYGLNLEEFYSLPNRYQQNDLFDRVGLPWNSFRKELDHRMLENYLSGTFMHFDQPVPGAAEFLRDLKDAQATVFYVSSRFEDTQLTATLSQMKALGMLHDSEIDKVILRPRGMSSIDFKKRSFEKIRNWTTKQSGSVMLVMENEPENMNAMTSLFPEATAVFIDGAFLKDEPLKSKQVIHLKNFR